MYTCSRNTKCVSNQLLYCSTLKYHIPVPYPSEQPLIVVYVPLQSML